MLLEREREVEALDAFVSGATRPGARMGLIEGPAGIGKSTLLAETRRLAESDGIRVLSARGSKIEASSPTASSASCSSPRSPIRSCAREPSRVRPTGRGRCSRRRPRAGSRSRFATLHALYWLTLNLAGEEPLLLAIDDLHWVDHPSLRFIAYLVRRLEELPRAGGLGASRPNEPGADAEMIAEIAADPLTVGVRPGPLSEAAVADLIESRLDEAPDPAFAAACHTATGGNPLLLYELLRALAAEGVAPRADQIGVVSDLGPRAASRAVLLRLARLPGEAASVARAIAVLGEGTELWAAAELAGVDEQAAADATGALVAVGDPAPRAAAGLRPPAGARRRLPRAPARRSRASARARRASCCAAASAPPEQVAAHLLVAPGVEGEWVAETLRAAATSALSRGAGESAIPYLLRTLEEPLAPTARAAVLRDLGHAEVHYMGPQATEHLADAYEALQDPRERGEVAMLLAWGLMFTRRQDDAAAIAARARAENSPPDLKQGLEALELFTAYFGGADPERLERFDALPRGHDRLRWSRDARRGRRLRLGQQHGAGERVRRAGAPRARRAGSVRLRPGHVLVRGRAGADLRRGAGRAHATGSGSSPRSTAAARCSPR